MFIPTDNRHPDGGQFALLSRFIAPSGDASNYRIDTKRLRKTLPPAGADLAALVKRTAEALARNRPSVGRLVAVTAVGFGPVLDGVGPDWWRADFDESKHHRWPTGAPDSQGGRFRSPDDASAEGGDASAGRDKPKKTPEELQSDLRRRATRDAISIGLKHALRTAA
jgi:hypothetical protein